MKTHFFLLSLLVAPALACSQVHVSSDEPCPRFAIDIESFATCNGDKVQKPLTASAYDLALTPEDQVPPQKRTAGALYVSAAQAYQLQRAHPEEVILLDIRSRAEVVFAGQPDTVDAHVPLLEPAYPLTWNPRANNWLMQRNPAFVAEVEATLTRFGADKDSPVLLLCRSGERSAIAADALTAAGFSRVYTVFDGFEGDVGKGGKRNINGWKIAGAPWHSSPVARMIYGAQQ